MQIIGNRKLEGLCMYNTENSHCIQENINFAIRFGFPRIHVKHSFYDGTPFHCVNFIFIYLFNKNVQPQFEDYAHVCRELHMCAFVTAVRLWS